MGLSPAAGASKRPRALNGLRSAPAEALRWLDAPAASAAKRAEENENDDHDEDDQQDAHACTTFFNTKEVRPYNAVTASSSSACTDSAT